MSEQGEVDDATIKAFHDPVKPVMRETPQTKLGPTGNGEKSRTEVPLVLGWRLARDMRIEWFDQQGNHSHGDQPMNMLETIPAASTATHTAIIAKSGAGKSFFLGRYLEEVLLRTHATMTIFDPNADFRKFREVEEKVWKKHEDFVDERGVKRRRVIEKDWSPCKNPRPGLPTEKEMRDFSVPWEKVRIRVFGGESDSQRYPGMEPVKFVWRDLSSHLLLVADHDKQQIDPTEMAALHEYVVAGEDLWDLYSMGLSQRARDNQNRWVAEDFLAKLKNADSDAAKHAISDIKDACRPSGTSSLPVEPQHESARKARFNGAFENARRADTRTVASYTRIYRMLSQWRRLTSVKDPFGLSDNSLRARVLDMPSFRDREDRDFSVLLMLDAIWEAARAEWQDATNSETQNAKRRPHLIVIDEAHNLTPADPPSSPLRAEIRERIKTIAGEGRKYGLFLVVVTQRPEKVDEQVLGECGNQAIMQVPSTSIIDGCRERLGLTITSDDAEMIMQRFGKGFVRLSGGWSPEPRVTFAAARRTKAGGTDLPREWTFPRDEITESIAQVASPPVN